MSVPHSSMLYRQSAFRPYFRSTPSLYVKSGRHNLMKRSFKFLRKIDEKRREAQRLSQAANTEEQLAFNASLQNKAAFHHMIAERNRRIKLKQHFSLLHSLLPHNSKVLYSSIFCITSLSKLNSRQFASKIKVLNQFH